MKLFISLILVLVPFLNQVQSNGPCPSPEKLSPCTCNSTDWSITCNSIDQNTDLREVLERSADTKQTKFSSFTLKNAKLKTFGPDWFDGRLRFKKFIIHNCSQMTQFGHRTLMNQSKFMTDLVIRDSPITNPTGGRRIGPLSGELLDYNEENSVFLGVMMAPSTVHLDLSGTQLTSIPDEAFFPIRPNQGEWMVKQFLFCADGQRCRSIKSIGRRPFFYLVHLQLIDLSRHLIDRIESQAFVRKTQTKTRVGNQLTIRLDDNRLNKHSFDSETFQFLHPNVKADLNLANNNNLTELNESVFRAFIENNEDNTLNVTGCPIEWSSSAMGWVKRLDAKARSRIIK